ncbi:MAG: tyrosine--tRNA ligase [archaeon]
MATHDAYMDPQDRLQLVTQVGEEIISQDELKTLLEEKEHPIAYDGIEPSGTLHIAQGLLRAINIEKMLKAGIQFKILLADWHAAANNKYDGDLEKIHTVGEYFIEVWKACGLSTDRMDFLWASDLVKDPDYWELVLRVSRANTVQRIIRCSQIMGRSEGDSLSAAQILYPCMQAADIFYLKADICQLGMDQRKVNVLAREIAEKLGHKKPIIVSHHMLMGLQQTSSTERKEKMEHGKIAEMSTVDRAIAMKMSKSNPASAIFMTDSEEEVKSKISKAYCQEGQVQDNPILEYCKYIIFERFPTLEIKRPEKYGGNLSISSYDELESVFAAGQLHPSDLKTAVAACINALLQPVRDHFTNDRHARELLEKVKSFKVTR